MPVSSPQLDSLTAEPPGERRGLHALRHVIRSAKSFPYRAKDGITINHGRPLERGWLLPHLIRADDIAWGRWEHWTHTLMAGRLLQEPIPRISWCTPGDPGHAMTRKMWTGCLNAIENAYQTGDDWMGWSSWSHFNYLLDWLLFAFGDRTQPELPKEPSPGACARLYQVFTLECAMAWPYDHFGDLLAENAHGRHNGFYPTPMHLVDLMAKLTFGDPCQVSPEDEGLDPRLQTFCDPCVGTGRMPLCASNHVYCLHGMDKDLTVVKATLVNGYLYAPWLVKPFPFADDLIAEHKARQTATARANDSLHDLRGTLEEKDLAKPAEEATQTRAPVEQLIFGF